MAEHRIILTGRANEDIIDIGDYITYTLLEPETAKKFVSGLRTEIAALKEFPKRYPFVNDVVLRSFRWALMSTYTSELEQYF